MDPSTNRPTVATLLVAFAISLLNALLDFVPPTVPPEVVATGYTLLTAVIAIGIGKVAQGQLLAGWLGETAPWSHEAHERAVEQARQANTTVVFTATDDE